MSPICCRRCRFYCWQVPCSWVSVFLFVFGGFVVPFKSGGFGPFICWQLQVLHDYSSFFATSGSLVVVRIVVVCGCLTGGCGVRLSIQVQFVACSGGSLHLVLVVCFGWVASGLCGWLVVVLILFVCLGLVFYYVFHLMSVA